VKINYKTKKLEKTFNDDRKLIKEHGQLAKKLKQRKNQIESAENLKILSDLPQLRLHPYKGNRIGQWSIDIKNNWRLIFSLDNSNISNITDGGVNLKDITIIKIESVEDPH
jgi:proteic killer suppression protein